MLKKRYNFMKQLYPNYFLIFVRKDELITFDTDYKIAKVLKEQEKNLVKSLEDAHINYLILDNLSILKRRTFKNNTYLEYCERIKLLDMCLKVFQEYKKTES